MSPSFIADRERLSMKWITSSFCTPVDPRVCVEVALAPDRVHVRDSKNPLGGMLGVDRAGWTSFMADIKAGSFDNS